MRLRDKVSQHLRRRRLRRRGVEVGDHTLLWSVEFRGGALIEPYCRLVGVPRITVGRDFFINSFGILKGDITIGDDVLIGPSVVIWGLDHGVELGEPIRVQPLVNEPIVIGDDVWIASKAVILKGVTIGSGAVVGAGAVVTSDVPERAIVVGNPARVLRIRGEGEDPASALARGAPARG